MSAPTPRPFEPLDFFGVRVPLLPYDDLLAWADGLESPTASDDALEAALTRDGELLIERLRALVARPEVREALYVASPDLSGELAVWERDAYGERGRRIGRALARYVVRMASRATPFGLFAGTAVGTVIAAADATCLRVCPRVARRRHARLDMGYVEGVAAALDRDPALRATLTYRANATISRRGDHLHYVQTHRADGGRAYDLVTADASPYLDLVLARAAGAATIAQLVTELTAIEGDEVEPAEAEAFVHELIDAGLLISDLEPATTGDNAVNDLVARLYEAGAGAAGPLDDAQRALAAFNAEPLGATPARYEVIADALRSLPARMDLSRLFQVDTTVRVEATLGRPVLEELVRVAEFYLRVGGSPSRPLSGFAARFAERYDLEEVPLLQALDAEVGIGLPDAQPSLDDERAARAQQIAMMKLVTDAAARQQHEVTVADTDLPALRYPLPNELPPGFSLLVTLSAESEAALDEGRFELVTAGGAAPSGALLFGRFCQADPTLAAAVRRQLVREEAAFPDVVHAELVHLPAGRTGNILSRPVLREYELPFLGRSGAPADRQLPLDDLLVSVRGGRVRLRSRRLDREVLPCLTSAQNVEWGGTLPTYRFLAHLRQQYAGAPLGWQWGALSGFPFLPRVRYGRTVVSRARWTVTGEDLARLAGLGGAARARAVRAWREALRLPRFVQLQDGDNALFTDFDNPASVDVLLDHVRRRPSAQLVEVLPTPERTAAFGPEGRFAHELVVPFVRAIHPAASIPAPAARVVVRSTASVPPPPRRFVPGSEWLYVKLYTGSGIADRVLRDVVGPVVDTAVGGGAADRWFFLRYVDPHHHIRVRFHGEPARLLREVLPTLYDAAAPFITDGRIARMQVDSYEREVERYGGPEGVELAERLFCADSEAALALVTHYGDEGSLRRRELLALYGCHALLDDFGLDLRERRDLIRGVRAMPAEARRELGARFRVHRRAVEGLLCGEPEDESMLPGLSVLAQRSERIAPIVAGLSDQIRTGAVHTSRDDLVRSYLHLFVNRVLREHQPIAEAQFYDWLDRFYTGRVARISDTRTGDSNVVETAGV